MLLKTRDPWNHDFSSKELRVKLNLLAGVLKFRFNISNVIEAQYLYQPEQTTANWCFCYHRFTTFMLQPSGVIGGREDVDDVIMIIKSSISGAQLFF